MNCWSTQLKLILRHFNYHNSEVSFSEKSPPFLSLGRTQDKHLVAPGLLFPSDAVTGNKTGREDGPSPLHCDEPS